MVSFPLLLYKCECGCPFHLFETLCEFLESPKIHQKNHWGKICGINELHATCISAEHEQVKVYADYVRFQELSLLRSGRSTQLTCSEVARSFFSWLPLDSSGNAICYNRLADWAMQTISKQLRAKLQVNRPDGISCFHKHVETASFFFYFLLSRYML